MEKKLRLVSTKAVADIVEVTSLGRRPLLRWLILAAEASSTARHTRRHTRVRRLGHTRVGKGWLVLEGLLPARAGALR